MYKLPVAASGQPAAAVATVVAVAAVATTGVSRFRSASRVNESSPSPLVKLRAKGEEGPHQALRFKTQRSCRENAI